MRTERPLIAMYRHEYGGMDVVFAASDNVEPDLVKQLNDALLAIAATGVILKAVALPRQRHLHDDRLIDKLSEQVSLDREFCRLP